MSPKGLQFTKLQKKHEITAILTFFFTFFKTTDGKIAESDNFCSFFTLL